MDYNTIIETFKDFEEIINEGGIITNTFLKHYSYPDNIKQLIKEDYNCVLNIIKYYYESYIINRKQYNHNDSIKELSFVIKSSSTKKKEKYINFNKHIFEWLININFFDTIKINNFIFRINQQDAIDKLNKNGLESGIHCQATGCGKSLIILKYIDYVNKKYKNSKIILFTERVNILSDLFCIDDNDNIDLNLLQKWKELDICDLTNINIINRVTKKEKEWYKLFNTNKPTLLIINRAYLTIDSSYTNLKNINLILHDECHNTSSLKCNNFLNFCKTNNFPIVGFSATPLRSSQEDILKLLNIYGKDNKLNLLTDYNIVHSINNDLIVKPEFYWFQIEKYITNEEDEITDLEKESLKEILIKTMKSMTSCKIIAWCGTIELCKKWKNIFEKEFKFKLKYYIDHSKSNNNDYYNFRNIDSNAILFCANKHREGSDIPKLDSCLFLDKIKSRGIIPFIQSIGRVLRKDNNLPNKNKGIIIDSLLKTDDYEKTVINKIFEYYNALNNISNISETNNKDFVKINNEKNEININIGTQDIKIFCNKINWISLQNKINTYLSSKKVLEYNILEDINKYDFYHSKIINIFINKILIDVKYFRQVINKLYIIINDINKIIDYTLLNISTTMISGKGFYCLKELNIYIQGTDSKICIKELVNQCIKNNFKLLLEVKLKNDNIIKINIDDNIQTLTII